MGLHASRPSSAVWGSLHLHYDSDQDALLTGWLHPAAESLTSRGLTRRLFFLRYWDGGPHVRVRYLVTPGQHPDIVGAELMGGAERFMSATPSRTTFDDDRYAAVQARLAALEGTAAGSPLVSNNTVRGAHYEPESTKYGGPLGLDIAEELFDASTSAVLALLPALGDRRPSRLGIALSMTLSALASFGLSWAEMTRFLERYRALWERYRPAAAAPPSDRLRAAAAPFVGHARAILRGERPKGGALARWADAVVNAATRLEAARGQVLPLVTMAGPASTDVDRRLFLLANYVHTHNNRLGLQPSEEAYLAQVATAALEGA